MMAVLLACTLKVLRLVQNKNAFLGYVGGGGQNVNFDAYTFTSVEPIKLYKQLNGKC